MKGITPVVAVVLLLGVTVAATGTLWTMIESQQEAVEEGTPSIDFSAEVLNVESCWIDNGGDDELHLQVRNDQDVEAINTSNIDVAYEFDIVEPENDLDQIVGPLDTFRIEIDHDDDNEEPFVEIIHDGTTVEHRCLNL